jgi:hypothetical protein
MEPRFATSQWFNPLGVCIFCKKPATGTLMSVRNDKLGPCCTRCAAAELKKADARSARKAKAALDKQEGK